MPHARFHANRPKIVDLYREQIDRWMDRVICEFYTCATLELKVDGVRAWDSHRALKYIPSMSFALRLLN